MLLQSNDIGYVSMAVRLLHNALKSKRNNTFPKIMLATVDRGSVYDSNNLLTTSYPIYVLLILL